MADGSAERRVLTIKDYGPMSVETAFVAAVLIDRHDLGAPNSRRAIRRQLADLLGVAPNEALNVARRAASVRDKITKHRTRPASIYTKRARHAGWHAPPPEIPGGASCVPYR